MYCKQCGKQIEDNAQFCAHCGAPQQGAPHHSAPQGGAMPMYPTRPRGSGLLHASGILSLIAAILSAVGIGGLLISGILCLIFSGDVSHYAAHYAAQYEGYLYAEGAMIGGGIGLLVGAAWMVPGMIVNFKHSRARHRSVYSDPAAFYRTHNGAVGFLVVNILFGGTIGIVSAILNLVAKNQATDYFPQ